MRATFSVGVCQAGTSAALAVSALNFHGRLHLRPKGVCYNHGASSLINACSALDSVKERC